MVSDKITRKKNEESSERYYKAMGNRSKLGDLDNVFKEQKISAEYDTWSWYYTELSGLRAECSRLGLLVRVNDNNSPHFLSIYNAHIISYLNMLSPLMPNDLWEIIISEWNDINKEITMYKRKLRSMGKHIPIEDELIQRQDNLFRAALKAAQKLGLGFKVTLSNSDTELIKNTILGE